ncbi:tetratricopeptide repeat protein [Sphingomonas sp. S2-65]|uniref:tetratricopeptide repeat protein n=1 Tax=Sphingomonas sp. S2-65 TaxID=2903960 RepID=UPI001F3E6574|nr:tetratricopeptide repeat protein [Sphingomonas sp. S2-65]UYY59478.1 tetratricopeptide repeat protein [Sphingomonas sp. S2-65]
MNADVMHASVRHAAQPAVADPIDRTFELDACFARSGAWAGVHTVVAQAYAELVAMGRRDILDRHNYELHMVLLERRAEIPLAYASLTDSAVGAEKTRNFPLDRAYRIVHGLVGLILEWRAAEGGPGTWRIRVSRLGEAQHLAQRFFTELERRAARRGDLVLEQVEIGPDSSGLVSRLDAEAAAALERVIAINGFEAAEEHYPVLLAHYREIGDTLAAAGIALKALCLYNHYGYYHESGSFADTVLPHLAALARDEDTRWNYVGNIFQGLVVIGRHEDALRVVETLAEPYLTRPDLRAKMSYLLSMIHLRYAAKPDLPLAERYILAAVNYIDAAEGTIAPDDFHFLKVFIDNGLAFLRVRQNRKAEALALCQAGFELLTAALGDARHRLHRSVLQYNAAQVYVALDQPNAALDHYAKSMAMDPHYSEYYNESANLLQRLERYDEALANYDLAIRYSAPYPEVFFNQAVCHSQLGQWDAALRSFENSLELNPEQPEAYLLRAEVLGMLGRNDEAMADLDWVITNDAQAISARVNRAVMRFDAGAYDLALADMDHVVALQPGTAEHYRNRAEIFRALGRADSCARDLQRADELSVAT